MHRIRFRRRLRIRMLAGVLAGGLALQAIAAAPPGYRYIGSRSVSAGRVVLWYWNVDIVEPASGPLAFIAHLYARAPDVGQERPYLAIVRCDNRTYRPARETGPFQPIDDGEPIAAVWRAGCANGVAVSAAERRARLDGTPGSIATAAPAASAIPGSPAIPASPAISAASAVPATSASPAPNATATALASAPAASGNTSARMSGPATLAGISGAPAAASAASASPAASPAGAVASTAPTPSPEVTDPRRVDACVRVSDVKNSPAGEGAITNTCRHPVEVSLCYKGGGGGPYDCAATIRGRLSDSLGPGVTHVLPEYRRAHHRGIAVVACRGTAGSVFPRLEESGRSGCF